nr:helix-turn-helix transcriptional regulator [Kitasatospora mediocidica]
MTKKVGSKGFSQPRFGWDFFGSELKRCREAAGLSQQELGDLVYCSGSYIGLFEAAIRKPQLDLARRFDVALRTDGIFGRMCKELIDGSLDADYFAAVAELQKVALTISEFGALLIPGLLQTEAYTHAIFRAAQPFMPQDEIDGYVRNRMQRARLLDSPTAPELWTILDENVLRRPVGTDAEMAEQLRHLVERVERGRAVIQVLPFSSRAHSMMEGSLTLMTFADAPPVAYSEGVFSGQLLDDPATVIRCQALYDRARAAALPPEASLDLIRSVAKEFGDE